MATLIAQAIPSDPVPVKDPVKKKEIQKRYRTKHRDELRAKNKEYYQSKREIIIEKGKIWARNWRAKNPARHKQNYLNWIRTHPELKKFYNRLYYNRHFSKEELYHTLQQFWCQICGEHDKRCLQFDHIHGGGREEQLIFGSSQEVRKYYILNPEEAKLKLQVLCANCNAKKKVYNMEFRKGGVNLSV